MALHLGEAALQAMLVDAVADDAAPAAGFESKWSALAARVRKNKAEMAKRLLCSTIVK